MKKKWEIEFEMGAVANEFLEGDIVELFTKHGIKSLHITNFSDWYCGDSEGSSECAESEATQ